MFAVVLTGPPGSGKSAILESLADALFDDDVAHVCIEAEALSWAHPRPSDEQALRHVEAIGRLYRGEGHDLVLVAAAVASTEELRALTAAIGADEAFVVRLDASEATLRSRIVAREPEGWSELDALLDRSAEMASVLRNVEFADLVVDTGEASRAEVARTIRAACPRLAEL